MGASLSKVSDFFIVAIFDRNLYSRVAIEKILGSLIGQGYSVAFNSPGDFLNFISTNSEVKVAIVSYDVVHPESFSLIEVLTGCFPGLRVVVIISKPTLPMILLMRGIGVDAMLSDKDDVSIFSKLILINNFRCYLSPVLYGIIKCNGFSALPDYGILTSMERFVLSELIIGGSPTSIALKKGISVKTVSAHKTKALKKIAIQRICELFFCY